LWKLADEDAKSREISTSELATLAIKMWLRTEAQPHLMDEYEAMYHEEAPSPDLNKKLVNKGVIVETDGTIRYTS